MRIPFNRPAAAGAEVEYMARALAAGHISGDGEFTKRCHALLEREIGAPRALLTTSCTHALEMTALLLDFAPGEEIILPTFAFVSCANAYALRGARPVFADIRPDTLNLDETRLERCVGANTRAVLALHYAGVACEMDTILEIAARRNLALVEDNAHGLFASYRGRALGTFGAAATLSFHETKNFTCGEGGALLLNECTWIERAEILREKGTDRSRFLRGQVDRYTWRDLGSSYLPSDLLAAFLLVQLEERQAIQATRHRVWSTYERELRDWADRRGVGLPHVPAHCEHPAHLFYLILPTLERREAFISHLQQRGILTVSHYVPLHLSEMGRRYGAARGDCPVAEDLADRLVRLPLFRGLEGDLQREVIAAVRAFDA